MLVRERFEAVQVPHRVTGTTTRDGQVVRSDCTISAVYNQDPDFLASTSGVVIVTVS